MGAPTGWDFHFAPDNKMIVMMVMIMGRGNLQIYVHINVCTLQENVGILKLLENENDVWRRINAGDRRPIQFHLYFPLSWPLPVVRRITSNNNVICIGNTQSMYYI
jgi:hypothetical protein